MNTEELKRGVMISFMGGFLILVIFSKNIDHWLHRNDWKIAVDEQRQCYGFVNYDGSVMGSFTSSNDAYEVMLEAKKWSEDYKAGRIKKQKHDWRILP